MFLLLHTMNNQNDEEWRYLLQAEATNTELMEEQRRIQKLCEHIENGGVGAKLQRTGSNFKIQFYFCLFRNALQISVNIGLSCALNVQHCLTSDCNTVGHFGETSGIKFPFATRKPAAGIN